MTARAPWFDALEAAEWALAEVLPLVAELREDAERIYEPDKGWPPHIEKARHLGDFEQCLADVRAALAANSQSEAE